MNNTCSSTATIDVMVHGELLSSRIILWRVEQSLTILVNIANILNCSVDFFLSDEYTYVNQLESDLSLDEVIVEKLRYCSQEKKETVSRIIDAL